MADLEWRRSRFQRSACQRQSVARRAVVSRETADRDGRRPARTTEGVHQPGARRVDCEAHWNAAGLDSRSALWGRPSSQAAMFRGAELSDTGGSPSGGRLAIRCGSGGLRDERSMRGSLFHVKRPHTPVRWRAPTAFPWTERRPLHVQAASTMALCLSPRNYLASMLGSYLRSVCTAARERVASSSAVSHSRSPLGTVLSRGHHARSNAEPDPAESACEFAAGPCGGVSRLQVRSALSSGLAGPGSMRSARAAHLRFIECP